MVSLGNVLFRYRNALFPAFYALLFVPSPVLTDNLTLVMIVGFGISAAGQALRICTIGLKYIRRGGRERRVHADDLVTEGIFAHCRNPLYLGNIVILIGLGVMANSLVFALLVSPLFLFMYAAIVRAEEEFLSRQFGPAYDRYLRDVNRWLPRLTGLRETFASMRFSWKRVLIKEYTTTYIWLTAAVVLVMKNLAWAPDPSWYREHWPWGAYALGGLFAAYLLVVTLKLRRVITA